MIIHKCRLCDDRDETRNYIISECSKLAQKEWKTRLTIMGKVIHWKLWKRLRFNHTSRKYLHKLESEQENDTHTFLREFKIRGAYDKFQELFRTGIKNWRRLLKTQYVIAIHLLRRLTNFYDFRFKSTATAAIGIHYTKARLSQLVNFKNAIWYFRRTICNKLCFKHERNATETYGMLQTAFRPSCMNRASVIEWHKRFKEGKESVRDDERCERSKEVNTPELIGQRVRVRVPMSRF